jgi:hypothetical protein
MIPDLRTIARAAALKAQHRWYRLTTSQEPCEIHEWVADAVALAILQDLLASIPGDLGRQHILEAYEALSGVEGTRRQQEDEIDQMTDTSTADHIADADKMVENTSRQDHNAGLAAVGTDTTVVQTPREVCSAPAGDAVNSLSTNEVAADAKRETPIWAPPMWQPIESAPKDGSWIVVGARLNGELWHVSSARYDGEYRKPWLNWDFDDPFYDAPTHWMPLPAPPKATP